MVKQGRRNVFEDTLDKISSVSNMVRTKYKNKIFQGFFSKHGQDKSLCPYMFRRPCVTHKDVTKARPEVSTSCFLKVNLHFFRKLKEVVRLAYVGNAFATSQTPTEHWQFQHL